MFGLFRSDPVQKLQREYERLMKQARDIQRNGDVVEAAKVTARAEEVRRQAEALEAERRGAAPPPAC